MSDSEIILGFYISIVVNYLENNKGKIIDDELIKDIVEWIRK